MEFKESNIEEIVDCLDEIHAIAKNKKIKKLTTKIMDIITFQIIANSLTSLKEKDVIK